MKRISAFILALVLAATLFAGCGKKIEETPGNPVVSGDAATEQIPAETAPEDSEQQPVQQQSRNPNPSTGEMWNGYDITFVEENGIRYIWDQLDNETKDNLCSAMTAIRELTGFIPLKYPLDEDKNYEFMQLVLNCATDYPYVRNRFAVHDNEDDGYVDALTIVFNTDVVETEDQAWEMTRKLNEKVDSIVAGMPDGSDFEKIRYLHDTLVLNCTYSEDIPTFYTAYGALVDGQATCQGYADAMHLLLDRAGYETVWCVGRGSNIEVTHKWNYVKLSDGKWYIVDPTWADPAGKDDMTYISYDYFLISDEELLKDHKEKHENSFFTEPTADSMEMNFHAMTGCQCDTYDEAKASVEEQIRRCAADGKHFVYLRMTDAGVYLDVRDRLLTAKRADGSHGEILELIEKVAEETGVNFNPRSWAVYNAHEDGEGQLTFIITLKYKE